MICSLLAAGKRVGITGTSHKVIGNLLTAVFKAASVEGVTVARPEGRQGPGARRRARRPRQGRRGCAARLDDGRANLAAGTSWLWASARMTDAVDVLFVDEAGQISLANVIAISRATDSLVLLGDPQQLDQPLKGSHPQGADRPPWRMSSVATPRSPSDAGPLPRNHVEASSRPVRLHLGGVLRRPPRAGAGLIVQRLDAATCGADGTGPRLVESHDRRRQRVPDRGGRVARLAHRHRRRRQHLGEREGRASARSAGRTSWSWLPTTLRSAKSSGAFPRRPASGRSTSSRARRRRSASIR